MYTFSSLAHIIAYFSHLSYPSIFLAIIASGHVTPIPEGVTLIILGYLAATGHGNIFGFLIVSILATAALDVTLYAIALGGSRVAEMLSRGVKSHMLDRYSEASDERTFLLVFVSHYIPGWRFFNPVIAALIKMPPKKFIPFTVISCVFYAPFYVLIGYILHVRILALITAIESLHRLTTLIFVGIGALLVVAWFSLGNRQKKSL